MAETFKKVAEVKDPETDAVLTSARLEISEAQPAAVETVDRNWVQQRIDEAQADSDAALAKKAKYEAWLAECDKLGV